MVAAQRIVQVRVGPPAGPGRLWDNSTVYAEFEVEKVGGRTPNKAKVSLYNLAPGSLQALEQPGQVMQLLAGKTTASSLFYGDIASGQIKTRVQAPDQVTEISAADGQRIFRDAFFSASYPGGTARSVILTDVLAAGNLVRGFIDPAIPDRVYATETAFCAPVRDILTELYAPDGAIWSIQENRLTVLALGGSLPGNAALISAATGMIGSPERTDKGISVSYILVPEIGPGSLIQLRSRTVTGNFRVSKIVHTGNSWGTVWESKISGVPV